jgi:hypothetical protein
LVAVHGVYSASAHDPLIPLLQVCLLGKALGLNWNKSKLKMAYEEMTETHIVAADSAGKDYAGVSFHDFAGW